MKFRVINESKKGNYNRKLFNEAAKKTVEYFKSLNEQQMIRLLFNDKNTDRITDHSSMFITTDGTVLNASDYDNPWHSSQYQAHIDIFMQVFKDKLAEYLKGTSAEGLLNRDTIHEKIIDRLFNIQDYCLYKFGWIKLNSGTYGDDNNCYVIMIHTPTNQQLNKLIDYLQTIYHSGHKSVMIYDDMNDCDYKLETEDDLEYVIDRMHLFARIGKLYEEKRSNARNL